MPGLTVEQVKQDLPSILRHAFPGAPLQDLAPEAEAYVTHLATLNGAGISHTTLHEAYNELSSDVRRAYDQFQALQSGQSLSQAAHKFELRKKILDSLSVRLEYQPNREAGDQLKEAFTRLAKLQTTTPPNGSTYAGRLLAGIPSGNSTNVIPFPGVSASDLPFWDARSIRSRLERTPNTQELPDWKKLITVDQAPDGSIVYTAKSYDPSAAPKENWTTTALTGISTLGLRRQANEYLLRGERESFDRLLGAWGLQMMDEAELEMTVRGYENLDPDTVYIFAPTHNSSAEFNVLFLGLNGYRTRFVLNKKFVEHPVLYELLGKAIIADGDFLLVNPEDKQSGKEMMDKAVEKYADPKNRTSYFLYPQGTRSPKRHGADGRRLDGDLFELGPLKAGVAKIALRAAAKGSKVKIVPITINGIGAVSPKGVNAIQTNSRIEMVIGKPIDPANYLEQSNNQAVTNILWEIEKEWRNNYDAPLTAPYDVRDRKTKPNPKRHAEQLLTRWLPYLLETASPVGAAANRSRTDLNTLADRCAYAAFLLSTGDEAALAVWLEQNYIPREQLETLLAAIPTEEMAAAKARADEEGLLARVPEDMKALGNPRLAAKHAKRKQALAVKKGESGNAKKSEEPKASDDRVGAVRSRLDQLRPALILLEGDHQADYEAWCRENKVDPREPRLIRRHISSENLSALYARTEAPLTGWQKFATMPLSSTVYTRAQLLERQLPYLWPKLTAILNGLWHLGKFAEGNPELKPFDPLLKAYPSFAKWLHRIKDLLHRLPMNRYSLRPEAVREMIPDEIKLNPVQREVAIATMTAVLNNGPVHQLPAVLAKAIDAAYGMSPETAEQFKQHALGYLNFVVEDLGKMLELYQQDVPSDSAAMDHARLRAIEAAQVTLWRGKPVDEQLFAALRDSQEAEFIANLESYPTAEGAELLAREKELGQALGRGPSAGQSEEDYQRELDRARTAVSQAYRQLSLTAGLSAGEETFSLFPWVGLAPQPHVLRYLLSRPVAYHLEEGELDTILTARKKAQETKGDNAPVALREFRQVLRRFLDRPGNARLFQAELMRLVPVWDLLLKNPDLVLKEIVQKLRKTGQLSDSEQATAFEQAIGIRDALAAKAGKGLLAYTPRSEQMALEKAKQRVIVTAWELLHSPAAPAVLSAATEFIRAEAENVSGLTEALKANTEYQKQHRRWAYQESARREPLVPLIDQYAHWREDRLDRLAGMEARLMLDAADRMMEKARLAARGNPAALKKIEVFEANLAKGCPHEDEILVKEKVLKDFENWSEKRDTYYEYLHHPEKITPANEDKVLIFGQLKAYNVAVEKLHVLAAYRYNQAAGALRALGKIAALPKRVSFTAPGPNEKLTPKEDPAYHRQQGKDFWGYMGKTVADPLLKGLWAVENGLPLEHAEGQIRKWGWDASLEFHSVRVDDRRSPKRLPGQRNLSDFAHNGNWYVDYSDAFLLGPGVLMAKAGLDGKMMAGMGAGVDLISMPVPEAAQMVIDSKFVEINAFGGMHGKILRPGAQDVGFFGAITMGVLGDLDFNVLARPEALLNDEFITGLDLRGVGRGTAVSLGQAAIRGNHNGARSIVTAVYGGGGVGGKPDKPFLVQSREVHLTAVEMDPLSLPTGRAFLKPGMEQLPYYTQRSAGETWTWWTRQKLNGEAKVRRHIELQQSEAAHPSRNHSRRTTSLAATQRKGVTSIARGLFKGRPGLR